MFHYRKIYVVSQNGPDVFLPLRINDHIWSWEGAGQNDGSWIGVVYPKSAFCAVELAKLHGLTILPYPSHDENVLSQQHLAALPSAVATSLGNGPITARKMAKALAAAFGHPALHPDT